MNRSPTLIASRSPVLALRDELDDSFQLVVERRVSVPTIERAIDADAPLRPLHGQAEPNRVDRLEQVVDRVDLERLDGMLIIRGDEDDVRRRARVEHPARDLEAGQPRHLHVEEHEVGLQAVDGRQRFHAVARLSDDLDPAQLSEQKSQLIPGQLLVVDENCA